MKTFVYRFEDANQIGIYRTSMGFSAESERFSDCPDPRHDAPLGEWWSINRHSRSWRFAFSDYHQLVDWFPPRGLRMIQEDGRFHMAIYEIDDEYVVRGGKQCAFNIDHATLLENRPPLFALEVLRGERAKGFARSRSREKLGNGGFPVGLMLG